MNGSNPEIIIMDPQSATLTFLCGKGRPFHHLIDGKMGRNRHVA
jgi:hypothetical protein